MIRRVFQIYVDQAPVLMPAAAVVFVITGILAALIVAAAPGLTILVLIIDVIANTLFTGMIVELVADIQDGRRDSSAGQLLRAITPVIGELIAVGIVAGVCEAIGFVLVIVPGLILITIWAVAAPVVVVERPGGLRALGRSRELVQGHGWQVFGVILVLVVGVTILTAAVAVAGEAAGTAIGLIVRVVVGILVAPLSSLAAAVLYFELRSRERSGLSTSGIL